MPEGPTPGPWFVRNRGDYSLVCNESAIICGTPAENAMVAEQECERRNAAERVRDAAPALLAACEAAKELIQYPSGKTAEHRNEVLDQIAVAIKAAEETG